MKLYDRQSFISDLIKALEDAEEAAQASKAPNASAAFAKLQYDFPSMTEGELRAVEVAFATRESWAVLNNKFLDVLLEESSGNNTTTDNALQIQSDALADAFHRVHATAVVTSMLRALEAPLQQGLQLLKGIQMLKRIDNTHEDENVLMFLAGSRTKEVSDDNPSDIFDAKINFLANRLCYCRLVPNMVFQKSILMPAYEQCLRRLYHHERFYTSLFPAASMLVTSLHDHVLHTPEHLPNVMQTVLRGLCLIDDLKCNGSDNVHYAARFLALGMTTSLASRLQNNASARKKLFAYVDELLLREAGSVLERCFLSKHIPSGPSSWVFESWRGVTLASQITAFFVSESRSAFTASQVHEALLKSSALRGLAVAFTQLGTEPALESLRTAILMCCAASPHTRAWVCAVPGFTGTWRLEQFTGSSASFQLHRAIFEVLGATDDAAEAADSQLAEILGGQDNEKIQAEDMPRVHWQLMLLDAIRRAQREGVQQPWGPATFYALKCINACVCSLVTDQVESSQGQGQGQVTSQEMEAEKNEDAKKEKRASNVAVQAKLLQPECIRLLKELRAKPGGGAKQS